jgi:amidase
MDVDDLLYAGIVRQAELIRAGEVSSRELTQACLDRIAAIDHRINAFRRVLAERALAEAEQADARRKAGDDRPLLGVPIAIKDDCPVAGEPMCMGSNAYDGAQPADDEVVRRLRGAGAIVIGLTHVPELMAIAATESPTWGATRNPWDLTRTAGGSSGGAAAAVAAGMVGAALGSDGAGSIRIPAASCHLFGLKPQRGRVPYTDPINWHGLTVRGPITRTVADSALFYDVIKDGGDSWAEAARRRPEHLTIAVSKAVPRPVLARLHDEPRQALERMTDVLRGLGHTVVEREVDYGWAGPRMVTRYLCGIRERGEAMPYPERLSRRTRTLMRLGRLQDPFLARALTSEEGDRERINQVFAGADVVMTPVFTDRVAVIGRWEGRGAVSTLNDNVRYTPYPGLWNHIGQPAMSVPAGLAADNVPRAVQFAGPPDSEPLLLSLAAQLEDELRWPDARPPLS